jgi:dephospho-CoA kinase
MLKIGLTGGIASGKSVVSAYLRELGAPVFDADEASRRSVRKDTPGLAQVRAAFGDDYLQEDGNLDRQKMADTVFKDVKARRKLEAIVHKMVRTAADDFVREQEKAGSKVVFFDVPLLIECGWHKDVDVVWLVSLPREEQVRRAVLRDKASAENIKARIAAQMSLEEKAKFADLIIDNSGTLSNTKKQVAEAWENLQVK